MSDESKGRNLEEEYFARQNKEAIEKLREKMKVAEAAKAAGTSSMKCPRCDGDLQESTVEQVVIDTCDKCGGIWLDAGEFGQITRAAGERGFFARLFGSGD